MAREWQPVPSFDLLQRDDRFDTTHGPQGFDRTWSSDRGAVLWDGLTDLTGSFPGFAQWGGRARSVHLTLTDRFLLVDEGSDDGFGLPIGWLSAAQALTGVEPIALERGDRLRVCYVDGHRVRGFILRIRGGRFGKSASRRANLLRASAITLGLASTTPASDLLLPPEHDHSLEWDDFASHESEPVVWTGRATMPVGSGLESASCDVWLTSESLIWGARSRAGIFRLATESLTGIMVAQTPEGDPVIYWSIGGSNQTQVDLRMAFTRKDRAGCPAVPDEEVLSVLADHGHRVDQATTPPQPWRALVGHARSSTLPATVVAVGQRSGQVTLGDDPDERPGAAIVSPSVGSADERLEGHRRRLLDDGLFPERTIPSLPKSIPLPWGDRVERIDDEGGRVTTPENGSSGDDEPTKPHRPATTLIPVAERLRIWPPAAPRRDVTAAGIDAAATLVHRPPVRATSTEEFLAEERTARAKAASARPTSSPTSGSRATGERGDMASRGVMVRFGRPESALAGGEPQVDMASLSGSVRSTSSFATPAPDLGFDHVPDLADPDQEPDDSLQGAAGRDPRQDPMLSGSRVLATRVTGTDSSADIVSSRRAEEPEGATPASVFEVTSLPEQRDRATQALPISTTSSAGLVDADDVSEGQSAPDDDLHERAGIGCHDGTILDRMRSVLARMDRQLALAVAEISDPERNAGQSRIDPTGPLVSMVVRELDRAVRDRQISAQAAQTHRQAISRTADTIERLRSLLDLHARGYLTTVELTAWRESLLGRTRPAD